MLQPHRGHSLPVLNEFEAGGYLTSHSEIVQGRERKVYTLTGRGRHAFQTDEAAWLGATDCIIASKAPADVLVHSGSEGKCQCDRIFRGHIH